MDASAALVCGQSLAEYRLQHLHRQGRFTAVYRAVGPCGDAVALKAASESGDRRAVLRLYLQAHRSRMFKHPGLLPVLHASQSGNWHFVVTPWLGGGSLADRLEAHGKLSIGVAVKLVGQIAQVIDVLHASGITHGGLQPEHILFDDYDKPVVTGLSYSSEGSDRDLLLRRPDDAWSAPENGAGESLSADGRTDVFGLANVLACMLIGVPLSIEPTQTAQIDAVNRLRSQSIDCSDQLAHLIIRSLSRIPRRRPSTVYQFACEALQIAGHEDEVSVWRPLAGTPDRDDETKDRWFVIMPSRQRDYHRMCRGSRGDVIRLLLRGRLSGKELAAPTLGQPFVPLERVPEFAAAAQACGSSQL